MIIAYIHQHYVTPDMPGGTRPYEMAKRLAASGHDVHMIAADASPAGHRRNQDVAGHTVHWLPVPYSNRMGNARRMYAFSMFAIAASRVAAALKPDIVLASSTPLTTCIPGAWASWRNHAPMVFEVRDLWPSAPIAIGALRNPGTKMLARHLEKFAYRRSSHVIALSPYMAEGVASTGYPASQLTIIPNACDFDLFAVDSSIGAAFRSRHPWLGDRPLLVYTGTIGRVNGIGYMVQLASEVFTQAPDIRFLCVGSGAEEAQVRTLAHKLGVLNRNFFMLPSTEKQRMPEVLSAATMASSFVIKIPELWGESANKVFDAMAAARPFVINHGGRLSELVRQYDTGLVLDPDDIPSAARALVAAMTNESWLAEAGRNAAALGRSQFDRDVLAARLEALLVESVARA